MESDEILHLLNEEEPDSEQMDALKRCMEKLPEEQRISITHFFLDEMSYADIVDTTFLVNKRGKPTDIIVKKLLCPPIDKKLTRLIRKGSEWTLTDRDVVLTISFE